MHVMTHIKCTIQLSRTWPTLVLVGKLGCKLCPVTQVVVTSLPIQLGRMVSRRAQLHRVPRLPPGSEHVALTYVPHLAPLGSELNLPTESRRYRRRERKKNIEVASCHVCRRDNGGIMQHVLAHPLCLHDPQLLPTCWVNFAFNCIKWFLTQVIIDWENGQ